MTIDLTTLGRVSMDLFSTTVGAPFEKIEAFDTSVGGSPTNIAIGSSRLGLNVIALTAVGNDKTGDFVIDYLQNENVQTTYIPRKADAQTGLAVVGIQPPNQFPLVFYRDNVADILLTIDDIASVPIAESRALLLSGTALSRGTCRDATLFAAQVENSAPTTVFMDLDLRSDQWTHPKAYGLNIRTVLASVDAFASGLIFGCLQGWDWYKSARLANACGALVVTRNGCSKTMPYHNEIMTFIETNGGF